RHERNERVFDIEAAKIAETDGCAAEQALHDLQLLMRKLQESVDQAEFVHHLQCRGVHGVTAEIAEEIGMLLQHYCLDARAPKQIAQHHTGRATANDAATGFNNAFGFFRRRTSVHDPALRHSRQVEGEANSLQDVPKRYPLCREMPRCTDAVASI